MTAKRRKEKDKICSPPKHKLLWHQNHTIPPLFPPFFASPVVTVVTTTVPAKQFFFFFLFSLPLPLSFCLCLSAASWITPVFSPWTNTAFKLPDLNTGLEHTTWQNRGGTGVNHFRLYCAVKWRRPCICGHSHFLSTSHLLFMNTASVISWLQTFKLCYGQQHLKHD